VPGVPDAAAVTSDVRRALAEDIGAGDLTAELVPEATVLHTRVICREHAVLAGAPWVNETFAQLDERIAIDWTVKDGQALVPGETVCRLEGPARAILTGERTALNFLQTLSGTATATAAFTAQVRGTGVTILDTRKTVPGLRLAQKYAVRCGGGSNHRVGLFDAVLIKENHIAAAGTVTAAVSLALERHPGVLVEVEVERLEQLHEAIAAGAQRALLDNFDLDGLREAVALADGRIALEASGNVTLDTVQDIAGTGVDYISTGAITKHVRAVDFSMRYVDGEQL
jgi:nicotinate-nucleotide pyrophosphorylase (carboxylating)